VFALDGSFVGAIVRAGHGSALVPGDALLAAAARAAEMPPRVAATIGIHLQALDAMLAAATGADYGVAVSAVDPQGAAAGALRAGDVITAIADRAAGTPENALLLIAGLDVSKPSVVQGLRSGRPFAVAVTPRPVQDGDGLLPTASLGVSLRPSARGAIVLDVERGSAAHRAGILRGDVITSLAGAASVAPRQVIDAYARLQPGTHVVLGIERTGIPLLVALTRPPR
jgi:S1-C subfamily serine protease